MGRDQAAAQLLPAVQGEIGLCRPFPNFGRELGRYRGGQDCDPMAPRALRGVRGAELLELKPASSTLALKTKSKLESVQDIALFTCFKKKRACAISPRIDVTALSPVRLREIPVAAMSATAEK